MARAVKTGCYLGLLKVITLIRGPKTQNLKDAKSPGLDILKD
jgi:hypothetical protein